MAKTVERVCLMVVVLTFALCTSAAFAQSPFYLNGIVESVGDGDTITVKPIVGPDEEVEVRFAGVDCPEKAWTGHWAKQPFSDEARQYVKNLVNGKRVMVLLTGDVTYGRVVGEVFFEGRSINRELVREGLAHWNKKYAKYDYDLRELQKEAKQDEKGLWQENSPQYDDDNPLVPPWTWRHDGIGG